MGNLKIWYRDNALPYIMRCKAYIVKNKWTISISVGIIFLVFICCDYVDIADFFFDKNPNGEFLKVLLSVAGGAGVFYGLWINQQRIREQNRQNNIVQNSNFDKRFSDSLGYLGSDNPTTVLGGIHTLYQLAKEDKRYRPIVANLLCSYLRVNSKKLYTQENGNSDIDLRISQKKFDSIKIPIIINEILALLFDPIDQVFNEDFLNLSNIFLVNIPFFVYLVDCSNFGNSHLYQCHFGKVENCSFCDSTINGCVFSSTIKRVHFDNSQLNNCTFRLLHNIGDINDCSFNGATIMNTHFYNNEIKNTSFFMAKFNGSRFFVEHIVNCNFNKIDAVSLNFVGSELQETQIDDNPNIIYNKNKNVTMHKL
jgi:uncharacterized protein YjbI with pentapeptide repeats